MSFWNNLQQERSRSKFESHIILKCLRAGKLKGPNRIDRGENLNFKDNYIL
jgi:hypothetical protein